MLRHGPVERSLGPGRQVQRVPVQRDGLLQGRVAAELMAVFIAFNRLLEDAAPLGLAIQGPDAGGGFCVLGCVRVGEWQVIQAILVREEIGLDAASPLAQSTCDLDAEQICHGDLH